MKERIDTLTDLLNHYTTQYYQNNVSEVSDQVFDEMLKELENLEHDFPQFKREDSPTARVGGTVTKNFVTVQHTYPMLSLSNTYSETELIEWDERVRKGLAGQEYEYICELKFDGISLSLVYENHLLKRGVTRGDGQKGDDITHNVKTIKTIPLKNTDVVNLPSHFEIRGEGFMPFSAFEKLNKEREDIGEPALANPRNTAAGTFKLQDSAEVARRGLDCYIYQFLSDDDRFKTHEESLLALKKAGFNVSETWEKKTDIQGVIGFIKYWDTQRHSLPCATDGIVVKVNSYAHREELGFTAKSPRWAISYKYKAESKSTQLLDVSFQVGRTGAVTPVAELLPVELAGTIVKRATLHNSDEIDRLQIKIGDWVFVEKAGEIIPKITSVDQSKTPENQKVIEFPKVCPSCGSALQRNENEAAIYCPNDTGCRPQILGRIEHFIQRKAMNIDSLGEGKLEILYDNGLIKNYSDLYSLQYNQVLGLEKVHTDEKTGKERKVSFKEKTTENIIEGIKKSKQNAFSKVLFALGIRFVGETTAEKLAAHFGDIEAIEKAEIEVLLQVPEVGERIAQSVRTFFDTPTHIEMVDALKKAGLKFSYDGPKVEKIGSALEGLNILYTGTFDNLSREEIEHLIVAHGGKLASGVSKKLDFLIVGEGAGPSKLQKAEQLGVKMINQSTFLAMIN